MKKIEKYLEGAVTEQEADELTRHLLKNKFDKETRNRWKQMLKEDYHLDRSGNSQGGAKTFRLGPIIMSVAAGMLLLIGVFGVYQWGQETSANQLVAQHLEQDNLTYNVVRKDTASQLPIRQKFSEAYNQGDYHPAVQFGEELLRTAVVNTDDYFFLGLSYLYLNDFPGAVSYLKEARDMVGPKGRFSGEINWFLSLAYVQNGDLEAAKKLLQLIAEGGDWRSKEAAELLNKLP